MKFFLGYIFIFTTVFNLKSQDFKKDMVLVSEQQKNTEKYCFNIIYTLHENHNYNSKVLYKMNGKYFKNKDKYLNSMGHITSLVLPNMLVMVNAEEKNILVKNEKQKKIPQPDVIAQLKGYEGYIEKITPLEGAKNERTYIVELKIKSPYPISKYEISVNTKNMAISRLSLFYKGKLAKDDNYNITGKEVPRLDIEFIDYNKFELFSESQMKSEFYFTKNNNKLLPTQNFKGYDVKQL